MKGWQPNCSDILIHMHSTGGHHSLNIDYVHNSSNSRAGHNRNCSKTTRLNEDEKRTEGKKKGWKEKKREKSFDLANLQ